MKDTTGKTGLVAAHGPCASCILVGRLTCEGSQRYGARRLYCSASCMVDAGDEPVCMVHDCGQPAAYLSDVHGDRCEECRPGGCNNCALWGRESCRLHRRLIRGVFQPGEAEKAPIDEGDPLTYWQRCPTVEVPALTEEMIVSRMGRGKDVA